MTAAKVLDLIARLPECDGQAADAVSAYTQVKLEDAPRSLRNPVSDCVDVWIRLPRHKWPKSWASVEDPVVFLEGNLYGHPLAGLLREWQFEKVPLELEWGKVPNWECLFVHRKRSILLGIRGHGWKKQNMAPMWNKVMKNVDLDEPTSFLDLVYFGCTQRECKSNKIVEEYRNMFESRISAGATEKLPGREKPHAKTVA